MLEDGGIVPTLYYVCTDHVAINSARIANRVALGGHDVPGGVVQRRYQRSLALLSQAIQWSTRAYLFDNSGEQHRLIAEYDAAKLVKAADDLPHWFVDNALNVVGRKKSS